MSLQPDSFEAIVQRLVKERDALKEALHEALGITDACCGCIGFYEDDGYYYRTRSGDPCEAINAALVPDVKVPAEGASH